jgi:hypothetical protein
MFGENKADGVKGAGPLPHPIQAHKSYPSQRLVDPSLSRWTPNPVSLPPRTVSNLLPLSVRTSTQVPTVPPRSNNRDSENWVDLEELYRYLQELEGVEPASGDDKMCGKQRRTCA